MIQGTTSHAGKSALVTGLCRLLRRREIRVAPFKPQNMALNSAVTVDNGEIGRAQALQAYAAGIEPHTDMNPVLLKPNSDTGSQIIIHGKAVSNMNAREYYSYKAVAREAILESYHRLKKQYEVILVEGAGSPAEINLRQNDIANMGFAEAVDCPVLLVADIDRGGVFAHVVGTLILLSDSERSRVAGTVINRFRGDIALLQPGLDWLEQHTGKPVLGVLPYLQGLHLEAEDSLSFSHAPAVRAAAPHIRIIVPAFPRISNHTDFDPLRLHPQVELTFVGPGEVVPPADLIILPGSKSSRADLAWLRAGGWRAAIHRHLRYGGKLIGICGGFQMLGDFIHDPRGLEGDPGSEEGLGLLDLQTTLEPEKQLRNVRGKLVIGDAAVSGYEIHAGITTGAGLGRPAVHLTQGPDGATSQDGQILGTYVHGLFESPIACASLVAWAGLSDTQALDYGTVRETAIDRLADAVEQHLDTALLLSLLPLRAMPA